MHAHAVGTGYKKQQLRSSDFITLRGSVTSFCTPLYLYTENICLKDVYSTFKVMRLLVLAFNRVHMFVKGIWTNMCVYVLYVCICDRVCHAIPPFKGRCCFALKN